jgi:hypothetical protein
MTWQDEKIRRSLREDVMRAYLVKDPQTTETIGVAAFDYNPRFELLSSPTKIECLLCCAREKYSKWQLTCLALTPSGRSGALDE